jgi:hypothetical protein
MTGIDESLRGFLKVSHEVDQKRVKALEVKKKLSQAERKVKKKAQKPKVDQKKYQQRWTRMVGDVTDGVGAYAVELLRLDMGKSGRAIY